ncbi:MAG: serine/threonine-protein kinase [Planctomycetes bacterium]|nr:serine/threonine-protein kinase [Planctomycetota bacterium]
MTEDRGRERLLGEFLALRESGSSADVEAFFERRPEARASRAEWERAFQAGRDSVSTRPDQGRTRAAAGTTDGRQRDATLEALARIAARARPDERYRMGGEIARGGMGSIHRVWDEDLRRELAMKRVLPADAADGSASRDSRERTRLARFVDEAQVTGRLAHPGIVPVHEVGVDAEGRAYFTMKLVEGVTLERVFERVRAGDAAWSRTRALDILLRVCEAMSYAHANGVIHRDLKPANVMVGAFGEVHVMDWGLARVVDRGDSGAPSEAAARPPANAAAGREASLSDDGVLGSRTLDGDVLGTLAYMSPEQARGELAQLGPATDVYALGAMLYELLAGHPPHHRVGEDPGVSELWRRVREDDPAPLSSADAPPELVAICEHALEREWRRRYPDMTALAADLRAFLEGRVVQAYRTGAWAEARNWMKRNRALAGALAAGALAVVAGLVIAVVLRREADENARIARENADKAAKLARVADERRGAAERAEALARERQTEAERNAEETKVVADFQTRMLSGLSLADFGRDLVQGLRQELEESRRRAGADDETVETALASLDVVLESVNSTNVAKRLLERQLFAPAVRSIDAEYADQPRLGALLYAPLATILRDLALYESGERCARAAFEAQRIVLGDDHRETLAAKANLALHLRGLGRAAEAEPLLREVIAGLEDMTDFEQVVVPTLRSNLALILRARGADDEAEELLRKALEGQRALFGERDQSTNTTKFNLGQLYSQHERFREAEPLLREALAFSRESLGDGSVDTLTMWNDVGLLLRSLGRLDEAEASTREGLAVAREQRGDKHPVTLSLENTLGLILSRQGKPAEAVPLFRHALQGLSVVHGDAHPHVRMLKQHLAVALRALGRASEAESYALDAYAGWVDASAADSRDALVAGNLLAAVWFDLGRAEEAESLWRALAPEMERALGETDRTTLGTLANLGAVLRSRQRFAEAEPLYRELLARRRATDAEPSEILESVHDHAACLRRSGRAREAVELYREAFAGRCGTLGPTHELTLRSQTGLGLALTTLGELHEAESMLAETVSALRDARGALRDLGKEAAAGLRDVYRALDLLEPGTGRAERAAALERDWLR